MADTVQVAVASNFIGPMEKIAAAFAADTGHVAALAAGSTGKFAAQIQHGAPFELLLAADDETPQQLERLGLTIAGSRYSYALGRLVLWSPQPGLVDAKGDVLRRAQFSHLALANPKLAPYGRAAVQTLQALGVYPALQGKLVQGENIAQSYQFVRSGNAELGFLAWSQVHVPGQPLAGSAWLAPSQLYEPIRQDAVLLKTAKPAAQALHQYLRGDKARAIIRSYGYDLP